jgi:hypothetical protein
VINIDAGLFEAFHNTSHQLRMHAIDERLVENLNGGGDGTTGFEQVREGKVDPLHGVGFWNFGGA